MQEELVFDEKIWTPPESFHDLSKEKLLEFSFAFLLERESNASILTSFDLQVISKYFSNYEHEVRSFIDTL